MAKSFLPPAMRPEPSYAEMVRSIERDGGLDDYSATLVRDAAKGVRAAQSEATCYALLLAERPDHELEALTGAEVFARLAAEHGEPNDLLRLAAVLMKRAGGLRDTEIDRARGFAVEAFCLLERLWEAEQTEVVLDAAACLCASDEDSDAILFDAAIAGLKPATATAIRNHVKSGGKK
ncbi:MAG: hypothetical protein ABR588_08825 [Sphingomicrobium sp.]